MNEIIERKGNRYICKPLSGIMVSVWYHVHWCIYDWFCTAAAQSEEDTLQNDDASLGMQLYQYQLLVKEAIYFAVFLTTTLHLTTHYPLHDIIHE